MNFNDALYAAQGLAYIRGIDNFDEIMPESRVFGLFKASQRTHGYEFITSGKFINYHYLVVIYNILNVFFK